MHPLSSNCLTGRPQDCCHACHPALPHPRLTCVLQLPMACFRHAQDGWRLQPRLSGQRQTQCVSTHTHPTHTPCTKPPPEPSTPPFHTTTGDVRRGGTRGRHYHYGLDWPTSGGNVQQLCAMLHELKNGNMSSQYAKSREMVGLKIYARDTDEIEPQLTRGPMGVVLFPFMVGQRWGRQCRTRYVCASLYCTYTCAF